MLIFVWPCGVSFHNPMPLLGLLNPAAAPGYRLS